MGLRRQSSRSPWRWFLWGLGNFLIVAGVFALLYVGGLQAYGRGRRLIRPADLATPQVRQAPALALTPTPTLPALNPTPSPTPPPPTPDPYWASTVGRLVIPSIGLDSVVISVGWHVEWVDGQQVTVWDVARFAVGHHYGSGNPGQGTNIVMAGHVAGWYGDIFRHLIDLQPGDEVILYGNGRQYLYVVEEVLVIPETTVSLGERLGNAQYMAPTDEERVTMITCWPIPIYDYRVIALARPYRASPFPRPDLVAN